MNTGWIEKLTGAFEDKKRYRHYKARVEGLPENYATTVEALERYLMYRGWIAKGDVLVSMLDDLADLFERGAADGTPIRAIVGDDPVEFAEVFLSNYSDGEWINEERERLVGAIASAEADDGASPS